MGHLKQLRYFDQLALFKLRGMTGISLRFNGYPHNNSERMKLNQQIHSLNDIGYYPLKSYSYAFFDRQSNRYKDIRFDDLVKRYYRDKGLKQSSLQAIEDIEASVNVQVAHVLGDIGALKYVEFHSWCQRDGNNKYLGKNGTRMTKAVIKREELRFLSSLQYKVSKSNLIDIDNFERDNTSFFPPVWLMVNLLTIGDTIHLIKLMSKRNRKRVADHYGMTVDNFIKWMDCLNLIRNICCHNGNLIDIRLKTMPPIPEKYNDVLNMSDSDNLPRGFAIPLIIIITFIKSINSRYNLRYLKNSTVKLVNMHTDFEKQVGFKDMDSINTLFV